MIKPTKSQAADRIQTVLNEISKLLPMRHGSTDFTKWQRNAQNAVIYTFGENTRQAHEFQGIRYRSRVLEESYHQSAYVHGLHQASAILESMLEEIQEYWPDDTPESNEPEQGMPTNPASANKVFVIHGRDEEAKQTVARFLESLGIEPVILQEQPSQGNTIIEKFEENAQQVGFAVALCTPDDIGALTSDPDNLKPRMRQNVVFELGYFAGAIGRNRVCALMKDDIERPSDYDGVVYIPMDSHEGWKLTLARELNAAGFDIDLNRAL